MTQLMCREGARNMELEAVNNFDRSVIYENSCMNSFNSSEVDYELLSFLHTEGQIVIVTLRGQVHHFIPICHLIVISNEPNHCCIICKFQKAVCMVFSHTVIQYVHRLYSRGLRQQPCGAPVFRTVVDEYLFPTFTVWSWPVRKSCNHLQMELQRPRSVSLDKRIDGWIILKALL